MKMLDLVLHFCFQWKKRHLFHLLQVFSLLKVMQHRPNPFPFSAIHIYNEMNVCFFNAQASLFKQLNDTPLKYWNPNYCTNFVGQWKRANAVRSWNENHFMYLCTCISSISIHKLIRTQWTTIITSPSVSRYL